MFVNMEINTYRCFEYKKKPFIVFYLFILLIFYYNQSLRMGNCHACNGTKKKYFKNI